jgi:hypothetical protein
MQLKHTYTSGNETRDIMDYVTEETKTEDGSPTTEYKRTSPAISNLFEVSPVKTGIDDFTLSVSSSSGAGTDASSGSGTSGSAVCYEKDILTAEIAITPDSSVMNTQYDEREYAVVLRLRKRQSGSGTQSGEQQSENSGADNAQQTDSGYTAFPTGTVFLFNGERLEANTNNESVIVPVKKAGTYTVQIETTLSGYDLGDYQLQAELYSANVANYHNSLTTKLSAAAAFTVVQSPTYALSVTAVGNTASRVVSAGGSLDLTVKASRTVSGSSDGTTSGTGNAADKLDVAVALYRYQSGSSTSSGTGTASAGSTASGTYTLVGTGAVFTEAVSAVTASGSGVPWKPVIRQDAASGTYRLAFKIGDKTEYLDFIVQ